MFSAKLFELLSSLVSEDMRRVFDSMTVKEKESVCGLHRIRYYHADPEEITVTQCESHGRDHAAYDWCPQIDPRWNRLQVLAYLNGYMNNAKEEAKPDETDKPGTGVGLKTI